MSAQHYGISETRRNKYSVKLSWLAHNSKSKRMNLCVKTKDIGFIDLLCYSAVHDVHCM